MSDDEDIIDDLDEAEPIEDEDINVKALSDSDSELESIDGDDEDPAPKAAAKRAKIDPVLQNANKIVDIIVVPPEGRITSDHIQLPELARLLSIRAAQIDKYGAGSQDIGKATTSVEIARLEIIGRRMPLLIRREIGVTENGSAVVELWDPNTMVHPKF